MPLFWTVCVHVLLVANHVQKKGPSRVSIAMEFPLLQISVLSTLKHVSMDEGLFLSLYLKESVVSIQSYFLQKHVIPF